MLICVLSGVAERFGDIRPDGESGRSHWRDLRGETEAVRLKPRPSDRQWTAGFILNTVSFKFLSVTLEYAIQFLWVLEVGMEKSWNLALIPPENQQQWRVL